MADKSGTPARGKDPGCSLSGRNAGHRGKRSGQCCSFHHKSGRLLAIAGSFLVLAIGLPGAVPRGKVVFDVDLTRGSAGPGQVTGGVWQKGWQCTGAKGERIVFDPGAPVANGRLEVSFTANALPWSHQQGKINYAGLHADPGLTQKTNPGGLLYARTGEEKYKFSIVKAAGRQLDRTALEPRLGEATDWVCDDRTVMTIRFEWRDGTPIFHDTKGRTKIFSQDVVGADTPMEKLRYVFIGSDNLNGLTAKGLRFTRVKLVDYGPSVDGPPVEPVRVSRNGRGLETESERPVFLLADTAWSLAMRASREDAGMYLRHRRSQRFNAVTFVLFATGKTDLTDTDKNFYGQPAFNEVGGKPNPAQPLTTPGADPTKAGEYDYWDHVDYIIERTQRLGLQAIVLPTWGSGGVGTGTGSSQAEVVFDTANAYTYGRWLGRRYRAQKHILWMLGGDRLAVYGEKDFRPVFRAMAEGLADGTRGEGEYDGKADFSGLLMSYHSKKHQPRFQSPQSGDWFHDDPWLAFNSVQHAPEDQMGASTRDWHRAPAKPTWLFEGRYEGYWKAGYKAEQWGEWQCRQQAWQTVFAGAFGHTYGHERVFGFGLDGWDWKKELDAPGARSMAPLAKFMNSLRTNTVRDRVADSTLVAGESGKAERLKSDYIAASRVPDGHLAMFYSANGRTIPVRMEKLAAGAMNQWWFNPRTGGWHAPGGEGDSFRPFARDIPSGPGQAVREFDPPGDSGDGQDWVLVLCTKPALY